MATKARAESSYRAHQSGLVSLRHLALCYRAFFILFQVTFGMFFLDLSIGRLEYHYRLSSNLGPVKAEVLKDIFVYHGRIPSEFRNCQAYDREKDVFVVNCKLSACEQNAVLLSESRQEILHQVRNSHPASRLAGEIFDGARGLDQSLKIEDLFGRKSCEQVIGSADKTNWYVDLSALVAGAVSLVVVFRRCLKLISFFIRAKDNS